MLNVKRCINIDARIQQLEHVLITFWMTRAWCVGVRQLINHREFRMPREDRVQIHFGQRRAAIFNLDARHDWHSFDQSLGFFASMRFDNAHHYFAAFRLLLPRRLKHGVGLSHARRHSEENL